MTINSIFEDTELFDDHRHIRRQQPGVESEWAQWCPESVPGMEHLPRVVELMVLTRKNSSGQWGFYWYTDRVLDEIIRDNPVIKFFVEGGAPHISHNLARRLEACGEPRIVITNGDMGVEWPDNVREITCPIMAYWFSRRLSESGIRPRYQKTQCDFPMGMVAGGRDHGRSHLLSAMHQVGLLERCHVGHGDIQTHIHEPDPGFWNHTPVSLPARRLGGQHNRFDVGGNMAVLIPEIERCWCWVGIDNNPFRSNAINPPDEKNMWCVATGTPSWGIWHDSAARQMRAWGFDVDHEPARLPTETTQQAVTRWLGRMMVQVAMCEDPDRQLAWYNAQGPRIVKNNEVCRNLHRQITQRIDQQWQEMPPEFLRLVTQIAQN